MSDDERHLRVKFHFVWVLKTSLQSFRGYSLLVMKIPTLKSLGLRSLKRIGDGSIYITGNSQLCYHDTVNWTRLMVNRFTRRQRASDIKDNYPEKECSECMFSTFILVLNSQLIDRVNLNRIMTLKSLNCCAVCLCSQRGARL